MLFGLAERNAIEPKALPANCALSGILDIGFVVFQVKDPNRTGLD